MKLNTILATFPLIASLKPHRLIWVAIALLFMLINSVDSNAQSTDIDNPTRLTSNEISDSFDGSERGNDYFYSFTAGSGEVVVTFSLKVAGQFSTAQYSVAILNENSKELGSKTITGDGQQVLRVNIPKRQNLLLRISILMITYGTANYRVRLSGAMNESNSSFPGKTNVTGDTNSSGCLPKQGTLIIKMKDGSKKTIDLSEAETVTIVP